VQVNDPAIAPLHEAKSNTDVFRLLAQRMGFEDELFQVSDEALAAVALNGTSTPRDERSESRGSPFQDISLARLRQAPVRLNLPPNYAPFAEGNFPTASGKCEFYSAQLATQGLDPLPNYTPPLEDPQTRPDLAARYPLQMLSPPVPSFLNSSFVNIDSLRRAAGTPTVEMHPDDAAERGITTGQSVRVFNDRGSFQAKAVVGASVKRGVVVSQGVWWNRYTPDGVNCNTTTSTALTDFGGGATFFDNLVQVAAMA